MICPGPIPAGIGREAGYKMDKWMTTTTIGLNINNTLCFMSFYKVIFLFSSVKSASMCLLPKDIPSFYSDQFYDNQTIQCPINDGIVHQDRNV